MVYGPFTIAKDATVPNAQPPSNQFMYPRNGSVVKNLGNRTIDYDAKRGDDFGLFRQHMSGQGGIRPALSISQYPPALIIGGYGKDADDTGAQNSGGGTYINLGRDNEGMWITNAFKFGMFSMTNNVTVGSPSFGDMRIYCDTQAWDDSRRSYYEVKISWTDPSIKIMSSSGSYILVDDSPHLPGFNQNKYDMSYCAFTYYIGYTGGAPGQFGAYGALQLGSKCYDLRGLGAGTANYTPQTGVPIESFAGGRNPGFAIETPVPGKWAGIMLESWSEWEGTQLA